MEQEPYITAELTSKSQEITDYADEDRISRIRIRVIQPPSVRSVISFRQEARLAGKGVSAGKSRRVAGRGSADSEV